MILITEKINRKEVLTANLLPVTTYKLTKNAIENFDFFNKSLRGDYKFYDIPDKKVKKHFDIPHGVTIKDFCTMNLKNYPELKWHDEGARIREFFTVKGRGDSKHTSFLVSYLPEASILKKASKLENRGRRAIHDDVVIIGTKEYLKRKGHKILLQLLDKVRR